MDYEVKFMDNGSILADLMWLVDRLTYTELDCSIDFYKDYLIKNVYKNVHFWTFLMYDHSKPLIRIPIGYLIARRNRGLWNDVDITGLYIIEGYRGNRLMSLLIDALADMALKDKAKRVRWHSHVFPDKQWWQERIDKFGAVVEEYKMFYCNLDGSFEKAYKDSHKQGG
jgi:hypothetical protein